MVLGFILEVLGTLFAVFAGDFVRQVKKCSRALVFVANLQELPLQKHANRTVQPLKIGEELMPQSIFRHNASIFASKAHSVASKLVCRLMLFDIRYKSWVLGAPRGVWRSKLEPFWRARWGTRLPKIGFFLSLPASE